MARMKFRFISALMLYCRRFISTIALFGSVVLAVASVVGSYYVPTKLLGIPVSAVGCFLSGWLFGGFLRKVAVLGSKERDKDEAHNKDVSKITHLEEENANLRADNRRMASQRIDVNAFHRILNIGLAQADMVIKDVAIKWMEDFNEEGLFGCATRSQYVGVLQHSFKAVYGVDLAKLRVHEETDAILVAGIEPESLGLKEYKTEWISRQSHKYKLKLKTPCDTQGDLTNGLNDLTDFNHGDKIYEIDRDKPFEGRMDLNLIDPYSRAQDEELRERINNATGSEFKSVNKYIQEMAKGFVEFLLMPVGKPIEFDAETTLAEVEGKDGWLSVKDFVDNYNKRLLSGGGNALCVSQEIKEG